MTKYEPVVIDGKNYVRAYSDEGRYLVGGVPYSDKYIDVCDPADAGRTYTEGDLIPVDPDTEMADKAEAYDILMGGAE